MVARDGGNDDDVGQDSAGMDEHVTDVTDGYLEDGCTPPRTKTQHLAADRRPAVGVEELLLADRNVEGGRNRAHGGGSADRSDHGDDAHPTPQRASVEPRKA